MEPELTERKDVPREVYAIIVNLMAELSPSLNGTRGIPTDKVVHRVRKQFKRIRALLRLMRDELGERRFREENAAFRDAGRPLSAVRDAKVMIDTLDDLADHFAGRLGDAVVRPLRSALQKRRREVRQQELQVEHATAHAREAIQAARARSNDWPCRHRGWRSLAPTLKQSYRQARRQTRRGFERGEDEALHESRKRTKDLRYQLELLRPISPELVGPMAEQAKRITDLLGIDHDLAVLSQLIDGQYRDRLPATDIVLLAALIPERRRGLQTEANALADQLFAERPGAFVDRIHAYWKTSKIIAA